MRFFAIFCIAVALYYGWSATDTMRSGIAYPLRGDTSVAQRRDDPESKYGKYLAARWLICTGFAALGVVMFVFEGPLERMNAAATKPAKPGA